MTLDVISASSDNIENIANSSGRKQSKLSSALQAIDNGNNKEPPTKRPRMHAPDHESYNSKKKLSVTTTESLVGLSLSQTTEFDMPPYILCNEQKQAETVEQLKNKMENTKAGAHVGFSGWFNYDIIAATKSERALICDINVRMIEFYREFQTTILSSKNREEFIQKLTEALEKKSTYFDNGYLWQLAGDSQRPGSWLATDEGFNFIKQRHVEHAIEYRFLDAAGPLDHYKQIKSEFERLGMPIRTVYASNIFEWLEKGGGEAKALFKTNMKSLTARETYYIDAYYPHLTKTRMVLATGTGPPLRITKGDLPLFTRQVLDSRKLDLSSNRNHGSLF